MRKRLIIYFELPNHLQNEQIAEIDKFKTLISLGDIYGRYNLDSALYYTNLAEKFAEKLPLYNTLTVYSMKGRVYTKKGNLQKAEALLKEGITMGKDSKHFLELGFLYEVLAECLDQQGRAKEALIYRLKNIETIKKLENKPLRVLNILAEMGNFYYDISDYKSAESYYLQAFKLADSLSENGLTISTENGVKMVLYNYLGNAYLEQKKYEEAIFHLEQSALLADSLSYPVDKATALNNLGLVFLKQKKLGKSKSYLEKTLKIYEQENFEIGISEVLGDLGNLMVELKNYHKAKQFGTKALAIQQQHNDLEGQMSANRTLYLSNKALGNFKDALIYHEAFKLLQDSILSKEKTREITQVEMNYEFDKEKEHLVLEQGKQEAILKAETKQTRTVAFGIGALALLGFGFFWNARRNNKKINAQNTVISDKNSQLEQLNFTKDRIFAVLGHDLRKPVISFRGVTEKLHYLLQQKNYKGVEKLGNQLEKNAFSLHQLTDNLLSWALTQKDALSYEPEQINVADAIEEVVDVFSNILADKNIKLTTAVSKNNTLWTDLNSFKVIVRNLVDNAIKYSKPDGEIIIEFDQDKEGAFLKIKDYGVGIPAEKLEKIFDLQKKKSQPGTKGEKGTGLGLYLVHELVQKSKGKINILTELNKGTTFELVYPKIA